MYKIICVARQFSRGFLQKDTLQTRNKPTGGQPWRSTILTRLICNFIEITPTHGCASENSQHTGRTISSRVTPLGNCFSIFKKLLFTVVKINLFTQKIRSVLRLFHSSYFTLRFSLKYFFPTLAQFFLSYLFTCCLSKYDKSRVERFSKAKPIFKNVFYRMALSEFEGIVLKFSFALNMVRFTLQSVKWSMVERITTKIHEN